jgi:hypothetical protein
MNTDDEWNPRNEMTEGTHLTEWRPLGIVNVQFLPLSIPRSLLTGYR